MNLSDENYGTVESWHSSEGWGVIKVEGSADRIWAHFSHIDASGFRSLEPGARVRVIAEPAEQDGYHWRATWVKEEN